MVSYQSTLANSVAQGLVVSHQSTLANSVAQGLVVSYQLTLANSVSTGTGGSLPINSWELGDVSFQKPVDVSMDQSVHTLTLPPTPGHGHSTLHTHTADTFLSRQ